MVKARRVVLYIAASLDGYIARRDGSVDWLTPGNGEDYGYGDFLRSVDTVIMGRTTYDQALTFGPYPYPGKKGYVFSRSRRGHEGAVEYVDEDLRTFTDRLRSQSGADIWLIGGAQLIHAFRQADLIDRYIISVIPTLLGEGIPLFAPLRNERKARLKEARAYPSGIVQLSYEPVLTLSF